MRTAGGTRAPRPLLDAGIHKHQPCRPLREQAGERFDVEPGHRVADQDGRVVDAQRVEDRLDASGFLVDGGYATGGKGLALAEPGSVDDDVSPAGVGQQS